MADNTHPQSNAPRPVGEGGTGPRHAGPGNTAPPQPSPEWDATQLLAAEYTSLREEVIKLAELQFQIVALTVVTFGTTLSVGLQFDNAAAMLVYPLLAWILVVVWLHHAHRIVRIAAYTRLHLEARVGGSLLGWEHHVRRTPLRYRHFAYWGLRSVFTATAFVATLEGILAVRSVTFSAVALVSVSVLATLGTAATTWWWREPSPELDGPSGPGRPASGR